MSLVKKTFTISGQVKAHAIIGKCEVGDLPLLFGDGTIQSDISRVTYLHLMRRMCDNDNNDYKESL